MAVSEIIGAAIGVLLLIIVAYVVVGSTLYAAETVSTAQKDLTLQQEARMRTSFIITEQFNQTDHSNIIIANITNTGTEIISDFKHTDVIVYDKPVSDVATYELYTYYDTMGGGTAGSGKWEIIRRYSDDRGHDEFIHPWELDPGERYQIRINCIKDNPKWFQITTANGVYASAFL
jgi:archaeal flagellar protein FlaF